MEPTLPHSASSTALPSPSSSSLLAYTGSCRWSRGGTCRPQTTASPPASGQTGGQRETGDTQRRRRRTDRSERKRKHLLFLFLTTIQSASHIEPQVIGPLADDAVTRVAVIGHLELEDVVAAGSISVLVEQNTRTCTSCREHRGTEASPQYRRGAPVQTKQLKTACTPVVFVLPHTITQCAVTCRYELTMLTTTTGASILLLAAR